VELTKWLCARGTTAKQFFEWADVDASGSLDMFELGNALKVGQGIELPPWDMEKLVKEMDINNDGNIDLPELDILLMMIRSKHNIEFVEFVPEEEESSEEETSEEEPAEDDTADDDSTEEDITPSKSDLNKMKKSEITELAKSLGLDSKGSKKELIERITQ
jgi:hypothetical protein